MDSDLPGVMGNLDRTESHSRGNTHLSVCLWAWFHRLLAYEGSNLRNSLANGWILNLHPGASGACLFQSASLCFQSAMM